MSKPRPLRARDCFKTKRNGQTWYCCCGRKKGDPTGTVYCKCAPMVGKNKVDPSREVRFRVRKDGKGCRGWTGPCRPRKGLS